LTFYTAALRLNHLPIPKGIARPKAGQPAAPKAETRMVFEPVPSRRHATRNRKKSFLQSKTKHISRHLPSSDQLTHNPRLT
jgi:hypothetical protein